MDGTDEDRLGALFRAAASDASAPPPGFGHADVLTVSRRTTARRRAALAGGTLAVLAVVGVGMAAVAADADSPPMSAAAPAMAPQRDSAPEAGVGAPDPLDAAAAPGQRSGGDPAGGAPLGPGGRAECANRQDPALRALVEQALPEVAGAAEETPTAGCLLGGQRYIWLEIDREGVRGVLGVGYLPPGTVVDLVEGAVSAPTASGGTVVLHSRPAQGGAPAPFEGRLHAVAAYLAPRL